MNAARSPVRARPTPSSLRPRALAVAVAAACGGLHGGLAFAQAAGADATPVLERVEVIGVTPLPGLGVPKDRVPANVQTARGADLERSNATDLSSFMSRRLGSVYVNEVQNNPFQPDVNFRGYTASPLLGTAQGLSIYMDGVRLNQPFGDVVSWDLIPKSAIAQIALMPGSNPLFGLNTLGGALSVQTKDGLRNPGSSIEVLAGSYGRNAIELTTAGNAASGLHWYVTGNKFHEQGWRKASPTDVKQLFAKVGQRSGDLDVSLTAAFADTDLTGNGLQDQRFLATDYKSVQSLPDNTQNRSQFLNFALSKGIADGLTVSGNVYYRHIKTSTYNGDVNDDVLDQALYQPSAGERAALTAAGYTGFPVAGETAANTPFPYWRCIAQALLNDEPAEKCTGVINTTRTKQRNHGFALQLDGEGKLGSMGNTWVAGLAADFSRTQFNQGSELGYLNADRSITGVGAFGDGVNGGDVDGEPYDTRVDLAGRSRTYSVYASDTLSLDARTHLTLSGRYNRTTVENRDAILPGGGPGSLDGDHRYKRFNPAIGLTFSPSAALTVYGGVNQGSRAPSAIELGCADPENPCKLPNAFAGDPPLKQVVTTTMEAGLRGRIAGSTTWNVGVFRSDNRDDLLFVSDNATGSGYFRNFGKTRRQGFELGVASEVAKGLSVGANFAFIDATYRSPETVNGASNSSNALAQAGFPGVGESDDGVASIDIRPGDRIPLTPRRVVKAFIDWDINDVVSIGLEGQGVAGSLARGNENGQHQADGVYYLGSGRSPGYGVLNLSASVKPSKGLKLFAQVNNIFDRKYSTAAQLGATLFNSAGNVEGRPFPPNAEGDRPVRNSTFYAPGAPRTMWVGLKYDFDAP